MELSTLQLCSKLTRLLKQRLCSTRWRMTLMAFSWINWLHCSSDFSSLTMRSKTLSFTDHCPWSKPYKSFSTQSTTCSPKWRSDLLSSACVKSLCSASQINSLVESTLLSCTLKAVLLKYSLKLYGHSFVYHTDSCAQRWPTGSKDSSIESMEKTCPSSWLTNLTWLGTQPFYRLT